MFVGDKYRYVDDYKEPGFIPVEGGDTEFADEGFMMKSSNGLIEYNKEVVTPVNWSTCECIALVPLTFKVDAICFKLTEGTIIQKQRDSVRELLKSIGCGTSDLEVESILEVVVPISNKNSIPSQDAMLNNLISYLKDRTACSYKGTEIDGLRYRKTLDQVLTVIFGRAEAYAILKLVGTHKISISFDDNRFKAYYGDSELSEYLRVINCKVSSGSAYRSAVSLMGN